MHYGLGDGTFAPATTIDCPDEEQVVSLADLDGDGVLDLVVTSTQTEGAPGRMRAEAAREGDGMIEVDTSRSACLVTVRREGIASAIGHDLRLEVGEVALAVDDESAVRADFEARSLRVLGTLEGDRLVTGTLSAADRNKIEKSIAADVLELGRYPRIRFESTAVRPDGDGYRVDGRLTLHGTTRELSVPVTKRDGKLVARVTLHQPDYGIKPFKAFFGALRVKPDVVVEVSVPLS